MLTKSPILDCVHLSEIKRKQLKGERHGLGFSNCDSHVFVENNNYPIGEFQNLPIQVVNSAEQKCRHRYHADNEPAAMSRIPVPSVRSVPFQPVFFLQMVNGLICMIFLE